ncbi:type II secretion system minor pseudopilin GspK [Pseudomonas sp. MAFF 311095]|uniref:Type II secretion system protein K n=1 Tax=Pseudomonas petroselini TaxID=2899822 RepID=A0ABS8QNI0_9PSED|nr:type II secretion system minor pseudopilin GspK [Pseudomonas petroselini]MCD7037156.1 type II secretion system minor pseudopilin GspK [Pseudomonas petroselini]MCD7044648.1 type II secretion system minor pseudopilin GspK [Pseudomonas petroselini]MCD7066701.1 type II secretion system minor pseudopilin GspK [Pseudomonas petroselini]MCD7079300.1 type II secretion system minor pseudopilin GspK [Pseudomonas petroselini]
MKKPLLKSAKQRGMAIISALLIAAVVAVIAAGMLTRQSVFTRSLEAEQSRLQGSAVLLGGLETSRQLLWDARRKEAPTRRDQAWAQPIKSALPGAGFDGRLEDQQGKFNLRNLIAGERVNARQLRSFEQLCAMLGIEAGVAQRIIQRVIAAYPRQEHSQSTTQNRFNSGRATSPDANANPVPATRPMLRSIDDLRGIQGVNERVLARLAPYVSVIPVSTWVNSNTASAEVLAAVVPGLSLTQAQALVAERDRGQWFINRGDFLNRLRAPQLSVDDLDVGITSEWFLLHGYARRDKRRVRVDALLYRSESDMPKVIWSRLGV